jgi:hypothetical protein
MRAASWLGRSLSEYEGGRQETTSTLGDVEYHLRALPKLSETDKEALVAMVRGAVDAATELRSKKKSDR